VSQNRAVRQIVARLSLFVRAVSGPMVVSEMGASRFAARLGCRGSVSGNWFCRLRNQWNDAAREATPTCPRYCNTGARSASRGAFAPSPTLRLSMLVQPAKIVDAGIDYFTSASTSETDSKLLLLKADSLLWNERHLGFDLKPWSMAGYHGWKCGRLQFGERPDGAVVRLSSGLAAGSWFDLYQITGRCSRVDVQVTLHCDGPVPAEVFAMCAQAKTFYGDREDGPTLTLWSDNREGATFYMGRRSSDLYFRGYNKAAQSNLPEHEQCLRLELEVKKRLTQSYIAKVLSAECVKFGCIEVIADYLRDRGICPINFLNIPRSFYERLIPASDRVSSLEWLAKSVRPTVQRLIDDGLGEEAAEVLGLKMFVRGE